MFKQRLSSEHKANWQLLLLAAGLAGMCQTAPPCLATYDEFLYGKKPDLEISAVWPEEKNLRLSPPLQRQRQAIVALYVVPVLLKGAEQLSPREQKRLVVNASELLPALPHRPKRDRGRKGDVKNLKAEKLVPDPLQFLRWRIEYFAGNKTKVAFEIQQYLSERNAVATQHGADLCVDLQALSAEFSRQKRTLEVENLAALTHQVTVNAAKADAIKAENEANLAYEKHVAEAYAFAALDQREDASERFSRAINYLRIKPIENRPQTDELRKSLLRIVDTDLARYEDMMVGRSDRQQGHLSGEGPGTLTDEEKQQLRKDIDRLTDIAYLAKMDRRLGESAYQFRRAYLLIRHFLPDEEKNYSALIYDLGETLMWDGKFDESVVYLRRCVDLRFNSDHNVISALAANSLWGRSCLNRGNAFQAQRCYVFNIGQLVASLKVSKQLPVGTNLSEKDKPYPSDAFVLSNALIKICMDSLDKMGQDERFQLDDALQGMVDSSIPLKQYDIALMAGKALLELREKSEKVNDSMISSSLWGLAYACDCAGNLKEGRDYYTLLIDRFARTQAELAGYWYYGRGLDRDMLGESKDAEADFKQAIALYKKRFVEEEDEETRDHLKWTIEDLQFNLKTARKYPASKPDYAGLPDNYRWRSESFPLRIYVDSTQEHGFGGELNDLVLEQISLWKDYAGSPIKVEYVDSASKADIYIERVLTYDDIPYGSAGRTSANFESNGEKQGRILTRAHVRIYCPSFDGDDWEVQNPLLTKSNKRLLHTPAMSWFAKVQLKTLLAHELGHAFGLTHSPAGPDIMYWKSCAERLSQRDINTVNRIYTGLKGRRRR